MLREHPINGVGVRGFRDAFTGCDPQPGVVAAWGTGVALHAHQIVLEVLSETGVVGLLIWLAGAALAWRAWRYADSAARTRARPAMLALAVSVFPVSYTHLDVYKRQVLEALAVGRPVLGWDHGGVGELLHQLFPQGAVPAFQISELTQRARRLMAQPPALPVTMPYTLHAMQEATLALYQDIIGA